MPSLAANGTTSQEKTKSNLSPSTLPDQKGQSQKDTEPTNQLPIPIHKDPAPNVKKDIAEDEPQKPNAWRPPKWLWPPSGPGSLADFGMFFVTAAAVIAALCTLKTLRQQAKANMISAKAALTTANHIAASERAYVKLSHYSPPGLEFLPAEKSIGGGTYSVKVRVENSGRTPAEVTDIFIRMVPSYITTPRPPPLKTADGAVGEGDDHRRFFLRANDSFDVTYSLPFQEATVSKINSGAMKLYVLGLVDYKDRFQKQHRAGFAREYMPTDQTGNNLHVVLRRGYNYDRERNPDEGHDWNEPV